MICSHFSMWTIWLVRTPTQNWLATIHQLQMIIKMRRRSMILLTYPPLLMIQMMILGMSRQHSIKVNVLNISMKLTAMWRMMLQKQCWITSPHQSNQFPSLLDNLQCPRTMTMASCPLWQQPQELKLIVTTRTRCVNSAAWKISPLRFFWFIPIFIQDGPTSQMLTRRGCMAVIRGPWFKTKGEASPT